MSIKPSVLCTVALALFCCTTAVSSDDCSFLTFGQSMDVGDVANCVVLTIKSDQHCCYSALRKPYCCDQGSYIVNIIIWLVAILVIISSIIIIIRRVCMYRRVGFLFL